MCMIDEVIVAYCSVQFANVGGSWCGFHCL